MQWRSDLRSAVCHRVADQVHQQALAGESESHRYRPRRLDHHRPPLPTRRSCCGSSRGCSRHRMREAVLPADRRARETMAVARRIPSVDRARSRRRCCGRHDRRGVADQRSSHVAVLQDGLSRCRQAPLKVVLEPFPPGRIQRLPFQSAARPSVVRSPKSAQVGETPSADRQANECLRQMPRWRCFKKRRQTWEPIGDRRRSVVHHVQDTGYVQIQGGQHRARRILHMCEGEHGAVPSNEGHSSSL